MEETIARASLIGVAAIGREQVIVVSVGKPRPHGEDWACAVSVLGLDTRPRDTYGADSLQALCMGLLPVRTHLAPFLETGGKLLEPDGSGPFRLDAYFPARWAE